MNDLWTLAISLTGIAGIGAFVLLSLYKEWIKSPVLLDLTKSQKYNLLKLFIVLTFIFGLSSLFLSAYNSHLNSAMLEISKMEVEQLTLERYKYGRSLLEELVQKPGIPHEDLKQLKKLHADYVANIKAATNALRNNQLAVWHEKSNKINELIRSDIGRKYLDEVDIKSMAIDQLPKKQDPAQQYLDLVPHPKSAFL